jgi:hypothetical protein
VAFALLIGVIGVFLKKTFKWFPVKIEVPFSTIPLKHQTTNPYQTMSVVAFPVGERDSLPREELEPSDEECPVCLEIPSDAVAEANNGHGFKVLNPCGHKVCWTCVSNMLRTYGQRGLTCPLCRAVDTTSIGGLAQVLNQEIRRNIAQRYALRIQYERLLHQSAARTMNRTRIINGPLAPRRAIPQQVPVYCLRCEKPGCQSKNRTTRRCANHPQTPCCGKCKVCSECSRT